MVVVASLLISASIRAQSSWDSLCKLSEATPVVVVFLDTECPLSRNYTSVLKDLAMEFPHAHFLAVYSGSFALEQEVVDFERLYQFHWPAVLDTSLAMARVAGATITPETVVLSQGAAVYRGAIDDWSVQLGKTRAKPQHFWIKEVLEGLANNTPLPDHQPAIGCRINL